jgi:DNA-binding response OmpR family regulator
MNSGSALLSGRRVLVVEDEAVISLMLEDVLAAAGAVVIGPAGTAAKALALLEQEPVDCAVLDIQLIDGTVLPVAEALATRGIRFVIATGSDTIPDGYNGAPVLHKVFLPDEVIEAVADVLRV